METETGFTLIRLIGLGLLSASVLYSLFYLINADSMPTTPNPKEDGVFKTIILVVVLLGILMVLSGCAGFSDPAKPRTAAEEFPARNQDPRVGLVVNRGTAPMNFVVYDKANRMIENDYLSGADRVFMSSNGQPYPQYWARRLEPGCYRVETWPFFKGLWLVPPRVAWVKLPKQTYSVCVGANPTAVHYGGEDWGWLLYVGANIPRGGVGNGNAFPALFQIISPF